MSQASFAQAAEGSPDPDSPEQIELQKKQEELYLMRKRQLDTTFQNLQEHYSTVRVWEGVGFVLAGGGMMLWALRDTSIAPEAKPFLILGGSVPFMLLGLINFSVTSEYERVYKNDYQPLPDGTFREIQQKTLDGEGFLRYLAEESRRRSDFRGVVGLVSGSISTLWYLSLSSADRKEVGALLPFGGVMLGLGMYSLLSSTWAEEEYKRYFETWKNKNQSLFPDVKMSFLPLPSQWGGPIGGVGLSWSF